MLVVISDLHFHDTRNDTSEDNNGRFVNVDRNVSADVFYTVFEELISIAEAKKSKISSYFLTECISQCGQSSMCIFGCIREGINTGHCLDRFLLNVTLKKSRRQPFVHVNVQLQWLSAMKRVIDQYFTRQNKSY